MNWKIHPVLYRFYLRLKDTLGAEIVHRRKRTSRMAIEVIFYSEEYLIITGRLNTLQTKAGRTYYKEHRVYQLFLSPVHPKKWRVPVQHITPLRAASDKAETAPKRVKMA